MKYEYEYLRYVRIGIGIGIGIEYSFCVADWGVFLFSQSFSLSGSFFGVLGGEI